MHFRYSAAILDLELASQRFSRCLHSINSSSQVPKVIRFLYPQASNPKSPPTSILAANPRWQAVTNNNIESHQAKKTKESIHFSLHASSVARSVTVSPASTIDYVPTVPFQPRKYSSSIAYGEVPLLSYLATASPSTNSLSSAPPDSVSPTLETLLFLATSPDECGEKEGGSRRRRRRRRRRKSKAQAGPRSELRPSFPISKSSRHCS